MVDVRPLNRTISCTNTVFIDCLYSVGYLNEYKKFNPEPFIVDKLYSCAY